MFYLELKVSRAFKSVFCISFSHVFALPDSNYICKSLCDLVKKKFIIDVIIVRVYYLTSGEVSVTGTALTFSNEQIVS